jgi:predicted extracellular nuclease
MRRLLVFLALLASAAPAFALTGDLYFTEYVEGSGNNKALEIFNPTGAAVNLSGYQVRFYFNGGGSAGVTINLAGTVADGQVFVLAQSAADPAILAQADQTLGGTWFNGDDAVALAHGGVNIDVIGQIGLDPGAQWGTGDTSTADNTIRRLVTVTAGDPNGSDAFDPSLEWVGFPVDTFSGLGQYPDQGVTPLVLTIPQIQGAGHNSPVTGELVQTTGVVTAVVANGFYAQDPVGDFVFTSTPPAVVPGDNVRLTAKVVEFQPGGPSTANLTSTELQGASFGVLSHGNPLPVPAVLGAAGSLAPTEVIEDDDFASFDPASDGLDFYECLEGMRVKIDGALAVSPKNSFREIWTVTDGGAFATGLDARSGITLSAVDFNPESLQVQLDPALTGGFDPDVLPGDLLGDVVGVMGYSFGNFEVNATQPFGVASAGLQPEVIPPAAGPDVLSVAAFNLHNLDPKVESPALVSSAADIDDDIGDGQFARLGQQIAVNLRAPDILSVEEVQDNDGAEQTSVTDASLTAATLIAAIVDAGGPSYEYRDIPPANGTSGGQPGGNIRVGFLFNPARVAIEEGSLTAITDPDLSNGDAFAASRRPLLARFDFHGHTLTVIANHFASKSGGTPLFGLVQPPVNGSVAKRVAQAQVVHDVVAGLLASDPAASVIVAGDLNDFSYEPPITTLKGPEPALVDISEQLPEVERYTYVFDGNSQDLDHILASPALAPLADYDIVHVNAEFEDQASDHDPVATRVSFPETCQADLGFGGPGGATLSVCGDPLGSTGTATLQITGLPAGATGLLFFGLSASPFATHGGTFVPFPAIGDAPLSDGDLDGQIALPVSGALVSVPIAVVIQFVYPDAGQAQGFGFSNAVQVDFLGA